MGVAGTGDRNICWLMQWLGEANAKQGQICYHVPGGCPRSPLTSPGRGNLLPQKAGLLLLLITIAETFMVCFRRHYLGLPSGDPGQLLSRQPPVPTQRQPQHNRAPVQ